MTGKTGLFKIGVTVASGQDIHLDPRECKTDISYRSPEMPKINQQQLRFVVGSLLMQPPSMLRHAAAARAQQLGVKPLRKWRSS